MKKILFLIIILNSLLHAVETDMIGWDYEIDTTDVSELLIKFKGTYDSKIENDDLKLYKTWFYNQDDENMYYNNSRNNTLDKISTENSNTRAIWTLGFLGFDSFRIQIEVNDLTKVNSIVDLLRDIIYNGQITGYSTKNITDYNLIICKANLITTESVSKVAFVLWDTVNVPPPLFLKDLNLCEDYINIKLFNEDNDFEIQEIQWDNYDYPIISDENNEKTVNSNDESEEESSSEPVEIEKPNNVTENISEYKTNKQKIDINNGEK